MSRILIALKEICTVPKRVPGTNTRRSERVNYTSELRLNPKIKKKVKTVYKEQQFLQTI
jgi:hypothetical protein